MKISRRRFVATASAAACPTAISFSQNDPNGRTNSSFFFEAGLAAWLNTLYPPDSESPGAAELGVHHQVQKKAKTVHNYTELLKRGMAWADGMAVKAGKSTFAELDESARVTIVAAAEVADEKSVPGMFFFHTLRDGAHFYYGHQESWPGPGFPHPPQPEGFPDYAEAPEK